MFTHPWITPKVVKRVEGEPGDMVSVCNNRVFVNDKDCGFCLESTPRSSKKFSSIESGIIPEGFFFVLGDHEESFDSRYKEMGLISIESIEEVLCPLF
jgi:conjugal transfer pilin signal peptidase TrbI